MIYKSIEIITCFQKNKSKFYKFNLELITDIINPKKKSKNWIAISLKQMLN